jgi:hypothetical protein
VSAATAIFVLQVAGGILEFIGALMMANALLDGLKGSGKVRLLVAAFWKGRAARGASHFAGI